MAPIISLTEPRIKSLLLLKLLSFTQDNPLQIRFDSRTTNASKAKITIRKSVDDESTHYSNNEVVINVSSMDSIDLSVFSLSNKKNFPMETRKNIGKIRTVMKKVASGSSARDLALLERGYNMLACSIVHELSHAYDVILFGDTIKKVDSSSIGAYLVNQRLCEYFVPTLNQKVKDKVMSICKSSGDKNLLEFIKNHEKRKWGKDIDDLIDRETARAISSLDDQNDMLVMSGAAPIQTSQGEFILIVDHTNENAIRCELGEPYVFGHGRYKFCAEDEQKKAEDIKKQIVDKYVPYDVYVTEDSGKYKVFEPYIFEEIIGNAIANLGGIHKIPLFYYAISPDEMSSLLRAEELQGQIEGEKRSLDGSKVETERQATRRWSKIKDKEKRTEKPDYKVRKKQRYLERNAARKTKSRQTYERSEASEE